MKYFQSKVSDSITIHGPKAHLASALFEWDEYSFWNPYIKNIEGAKKPGSTIKVEFQLGAGMTLPLTCKLSDYDPERMSMVWTYKAPLGFLYKARHSFKVRELGPGAFELTQTEEMSGLFGCKHQLIMQALLKRNFKAMHKSLKRRVETVLA